MAGSGRLRWVVMPLAGVVVVGAGVGSVALGGLGAAPARHRPSANAPALASNKATKPTQAVTVASVPSTGPMRVVTVSPAAGPAISGHASVTVRFSQPLAADAPAPTLSPAVAGQWSRPTPDTYQFTPSGGLLPGSAEAVVVPAGTRSTGGVGTPQAVGRRWTVGLGSVVRLQQLLAELGYLPLTFSPKVAVPATVAGQATAAFAPPAGSFAWRYAHTPAELQSFWAPGQYNTMTRGAVMAFESQAGLAVDGQAGPLVWKALVNAALAHQTNPAGYSWFHVSQGAPESLTVWHDGSTVLTTAANTGIPQSPTAPGTYPVYLRYLSQTMTGTNPNGTTYSDPGIPDVAYFNGGDAVHGFIRAAYGFRQSLGCVELPFAQAAQAWNYDGYGTLVTVDPLPA